MPPEVLATINSALFVDFDNVFGNLDSQDSYLARQFAYNPSRWLEWLETHLPPAMPVSNSPRRRILIRKAYLNPQRFASFRPYFILSAFEVVDCPPLTSRMKTSTDIHMVMDILDALNHPTHFDEFILLSGDADFTPVLLRLREHARYSSVLSVGYVSPAYKASCDKIISQETFVREALGILEQEEVLPVEVENQQLIREQEPVLHKMAARVHAVATPPYGIEASELPAVYKEFEEFRDGMHWLGFYSLRRLTEAIVGLRDDLRILEEDPWRVVRAAIPAPAEAGPQSEQGEAFDYSEVQAGIAEWVQATVSASPKAVPMATLADAIRDRFGTQIADSDWLGAGSFKGMLGQLDLGALQVYPVVPGYVFDPERHTPPQDGSSEIDDIGLDEFSLRYPELAPLAKKVSQLTDTPYLLPETYALILREIARHINESGYHMSTTSKTVRDRCVERGARVARSHVDFVLIGISYGGHRFGAEQEDPLQLGEVLVKNTRTLCQRAQLELSEADMQVIRAWMLGKLEGVEVTG